MATAQDQAGHTRAGQCFYHIVPIALTTAMFLLFNAKLSVRGENKVVCASCLCIPA